MELCVFLLELFEGFFELVGKTVIDGILHLCMWIAGMIVPEKTLSDRARRRIRRAVTAYTALLVIAFIIGLILLTESAAGVLALSLTLIPLSLIGLQLVAGIALRIFLFVEGKK